MAALSMVVIAAMVGGVNDIGLEVYNTMREAKFGQSLLSGLVIALIAMVTDRITRSFAHRRDAGVQIAAGMRGSSHLGGAVALVMVLARRSFRTSGPSRKRPVLSGGAMNPALDWFTRTAFPVTSAIKAWTSIS